MARKSSTVIMEGLKARGFTPLTEPRRIRAGCHQRAAGAACWFVIVLNDAGGRVEILSWFTMAEVARCPVEKWSIEHGQEGEVRSVDLSLDIPWPQKAVSSN
jgi:hypothetical protein